MTLKSTDSPPPAGARYRVADFVEIRCLASQSRAFSVEELQDLRKRRDSDGDETPQSSDRELLLERGGPTSDTDLLLDLADEDEMTDPVPDDPDDEIVTSAGAGARDDALDSESTEVAKHLAYRAEAFGDTYPFEVVDPGVLEVRDMTDPRQLYVALLVAANLRHVRARAEATALTTYFELLAPAAVRGVLGETAEIHLFGTSTNAAPGRYTGSLRVKAEKLAEDLHMRLLVQEDDPVVTDGNQGDHGLDLVAFFPFADTASTLPTLFAQCACGIEPWPKMEEPTESHWHNILKFNSPVINMLLIPQCFRRPDGDWYAETRIRRGVLIDRLRLVRAILDAQADLPVAADAWPSVLTTLVEPGENEEAE